MGAAACALKALPAHVLLDVAAYGGRLSWAARDVAGAGAGQGLKTLVAGRRMARTQLRAPLAPLLRRRTCAR
jgi:hypothetical protein